MRVLATRMSVILSLAVAAALSACDTAPAASNAAADASPAPAGPFFATDADTAMALIDTFGAPWHGGRRSPPMGDTRTGGTVRTITDADGSAQVFAWPGGEVWQVRLIAGGAGKCGDIAALRAAIPKLVAGLSPETRMTAAERTAISDDLIETSARDHQLARAKVQVVGGCRQWLTVTAG